MKGLVLIDLDKTLIDEQYSITTKRIFGAISIMQEGGWTLGLNSDTPLLPLQEWHNSSPFSSFKGLHPKINGPIIAEKGALVQFTDGTRIALSNAQEIIMQTKEMLVKKFVSISENTLFIGDATEFVHVGRWITGYSNVLIALNNLRQYSLSFFVRGIRNRYEGLIMDRELFREILGQIQPLIPNELVQSQSEEYCIFLLHPRDCNKTQGVAEIITKESYDRVIMIGDSINDFIDLPNVDTMAVGNAQQALKDVAVYVAKETYSFGVAEILTRIYRGEV